MPPICDKMKGNQYKKSAIIQDHKRRALQRAPWIIFLFMAFCGYFIIVLSHCELSACLRPPRLPFNCHCQSQRPRQLAEPQAFHVLSSEKSKIGRPCATVYSTFYDHRDHAVKVVTDNDLSCFRDVSVTCQLWYKNRSDPFLSDLTFDYHLLRDENHEVADRLGAVYSCNAMPEATALPEAVAFYSQRDFCRCSPTLSMKITYPDKPFRRFSVCVPALYGNLSAQDFVGFVELHRILGAEKFYFYNEVVSEEVERLLDSYSQRGLVEVLRWRPRYPPYRTYHNQQVMQMDCVLRNLRQSEWVAQMDVDEGLLPTRGLTWPQVVSAYGHDDTGALIFLNRFFADDESENCSGTRRRIANYVPVYDSGVSQLQLSDSNRWVPVYFRRLKYYDEAFPSGVRSKVLYRPEATAQARTHDAVLRPGYRTVTLSYDQAANYHYRHDPMVSTAQTLIDRSACFHQAALTRSMQRFATTKTQLTNQKLLDETT